jgi:hypothetical protein
MKLPRSTFGFDRGIVKLRDTSYSCCDFIGGDSSDAIPYGLTPELRPAMSANHNLKLIAMRFAALRYIPILEVDRHRHDLMGKKILEEESRSNGRRTKEDHSTRHQEHAIDECPLDWLRRDDAGSLLKGILRR